MTLFTRGGKRPEAPPVPATVSQARLDAISSPTPVYWQSLVRWTGRMTHDPVTFSNEELEARLDELAPRIAELKATLSSPPPEWTGPEWTAAHEKLRRLEGQRDAIRETLERRARRVPWLTSEQVRRLAGDTSSPGSKRSTSTEDWGSDPFATE